MRFAPRRRAWRRGAKNQNLAHWPCFRAAVLLPPVIEELTRQLRMALTWLEKTCVGFRLPTSSRLPPTVLLYIAVGALVAVTLSVPEIVLPAHDGELEPILTGILLARIVRLPPTDEPQTWFVTVDLASSKTV